jgi:NitT/TauT family transport system substrate-binding protein
VAHYREIINSRFKLKAELVDSLPKDLKFAHAKGPRQEDMERAEKWLTNGNNR